MRQQKQRYSKFRIAGAHYIWQTIVIAIFALTNSGILQAQTTCEGDIYLRSQADVDNFGANGCEVVTGDLWIEGTDITNLNVLSGISRVGKDLLISSPDGVLTNIDGLSGITSVGGGLYISRNSKLTNVDGLANITMVGGMLGIFLNDSLANIDGLSSLTSIGRRGIYISSNASLNNINGLSAITSVIDTLDISRNSALKNLDGLSGLSSIEKKISVLLNDSLVNINGLSVITSVEEDIQIGNNPMLTNIDGLSNLTSVGSISIASCRSLTNVNALLGLTSVEGNVNISSNIFLENIDGLANLISIGDELIISYNTMLTNINSLSNLASVDSSVLINNNAALTNINGLSSLSTIGKTLFIKDNTALSNIKGLSSLSSVGHDVYIWNNDALLNLDGMFSLTSIGRSLTIRDNLSLINIDGLSSLVEVGGDLNIMYNPSLHRCCGLYTLLRTGTVGGSVYILSSGSGCTEGEIFNGEPCDFYSCDEGFAISSQEDLNTVAALGCSKIGSLYIQGTDLTNLDALSGVTSIEGDVYIGQNYSLSNLDGLRNLTSIGGKLELFFNGALLKNIDCFSNLTSVGSISIMGHAFTNINSLSGIDSVDGEVKIVNNPFLTNIDGLSNLTSAGYIVIEDNNALENIDGLSSLMTLGEYSLSIKIDKNPSLTRCCGIYPILVYGTVPGQIIIEDNGCDECTKEGVLSSGGCTLVEIQEVIDEVVELIEAGTLTEGQGNALKTKLVGAIGKLIQDEFAVAINKLNAFINQVNAFISAGVLTETEGQGLISAVNDIIDQINNEIVLPKRGSNDMTEEIQIEKPEIYSLAQNYPNPFNPTTTIVYGLPEDASVVLKIYNVLGAEVMRFTEGRKTTGYHKVSFDALNLPSGIYFYRIQADSFLETKKMVLLK